MAPLIEFRNVYKIYQMGDTQVRAADGISMKIDPGEFVAIVGQSGSGKSTCMNIIGCLDVPTHGQYLLKGQDVGKMKDDQLADIRNKTLGFIFQQYNLLPKLNLLENVEVSLMYAGVPKRQRAARARQVLERVGLGDKVKHKPSQGVHRPGSGGKPLCDLGRRAYRRSGFPDGPGRAGPFAGSARRRQYHCADYPR